MTFQIYRHERGNVLAQMQRYLKGQNGKAFTGRTPQILLARTRRGKRNCFHLATDQTHDKIATHFRRPQIVPLKDVVGNAFCPI
jgi:hypothetical protein